jgi:hypothetical protein
MGRIPLLGNPYDGKSLIASGQEAVNIYAEKNSGDPQAPVPVTWYPTPGSAVWANPLLESPVRATYRTSIGTAYVVVGTNLYFLTEVQTLVFLGFIADRPSQVIMSDNGLVTVLTDGVNGYVINMETNEFAQILDANFYGASWCAYLDTFFIFNRPSTNQFYISASMANFGLLSNTAIASGTIVGGSLYTNGTYENVSLTGGSGEGATATIIITGAAVTTVNVADGGKNYMLGDVLSASASDLGGTGSGFTYTITEMGTAFDPLDIAAKSGSADPIVAIIALHKELWLIGELTCEVWIGTGAADFYFQLQQGAYIDHGCLAQYSVAYQDIVSFWLMQDKQGKCIVVQGGGYKVTEISTPRLVAAFSKYSTVDDAIGFCFQIDDHAFYCLIFPTENKTWLYDLTTKYWNEWVWTDPDTGDLNRHRANCGMYVYGKNLIGDWENGKIIELNSDLYEDEEGPITHIRTFMHLLNEGDRATYDQFVADMECGTSVQTSEDDPDPEILLSWSDDRGKSFGNKIAQSLGREGEWLTQPSWNRLGMARDRVFKLEWSANCKTSLNGAWVDVTPHFA